MKSGSEFIRNNSKVRFVKEAQYRVDKPDYAKRAVTEALVNALIHHDYIVLGSEVHIDMFDDRVEITSPGGIFGGGSIQEYDIYSIRSMRRNPVIADLFHRICFKRIFHLTNHLNTLFISNAVYWSTSLWLT